MHLPYSLSDAVMAFSAASISAAVVLLVLIFAIRRFVSGPPKIAPETPSSKLSVNCPYERAREAIDRRYERGLIDEERYLKMLSGLRSRRRLDSPDPH